MIINVLNGRVVEYLPSNCLTKRVNAAVSVFFGPCCHDLLNCINVDVHTAVLFGK